MKGETKLTFVTSSELRAQVIAAAADKGITPSEFVRLATMHVLKEKPELADRSGMRKKGGFPHAA
jgi:hypothetical protein